MPSQIVPVIMCGGAGTRLWPVSRESMPKQFVPLVGPVSTFQQVLERVSDTELFGRPIVITHADFRFVVAEQMRERGIEADVVLEPVRRDLVPRSRSPLCWRQSATRKLSYCSWPPITSYESPTNSAMPAERRRKPRPKVRS